jgi:two-component system sensor histidine kinase HydH
MTSALAHDLRNPLTMLLGYADLARAQAVRGGDPAVIAGELEQVRGAADRLRRMIEEILDFARGGVPKLSLEAVAVRRFLEQALAPLAADLEERGIATTLDLDLAEDARATLDRDRFTRILENLLRNAREAVSSDPGGDPVNGLNDPVKGREKRVWVRARIEDGSLAVRVADTGPGLSEEAVRHLFEPFATAKKQGTGLGLVTVRSLIEAHGGEVRVETHAPEGGAAFTVLVPLRPA